MSNNCIVSNCPNASGAGPDVSMFFLPADKYSATLWLRRVGRLDLQRPSGNSYKYLHQVCCKHFSKQQFNMHGSFSKPRLLPNALPDQALPVNPDLFNYSSWPTPIAPKPPADEPHRAGLVKSDVTRAAAAGSPLVHVPVECELGDDAQEADSEGEEHSSETSPDAVNSRQASSSQVLQLKLDTIGSVQGIQAGSDMSAKRVVRLHLPRGLTVQEFTASKTFKNITSKLPSLVDLNSGNKPILLKVPLSAGGASKVNSSEAASGTSADVAEVADGSARENLSANISGGSTATKIQLVRVKASSALCSGAASAQPLRRSRRLPVQTARYLDTCHHQDEDEEDVDDVDDPAEDSVNGRGSAKRELSESEPWRSKINILKKRKLDDCGIDLPLPQDNETGASAGEQELPSHTGSSLEGRGDSVSDKRAYYKFMHDLDVKRRQRNNLLDKIRRQKELLIKRGNELHRYRVQLQRIREKTSKRRDMTTAECIKVLNGNMREHALELLYTQLVAAESSRASSVSQLLPGGDVSSCSAARTGDVKPSISACSESGGEAATEQLVYTPKVLEAALLFSVAGKKAYKAMTQSLKLPPYTEIVKWKKIIRSNPPFYKKHFPNLKAKFFKKKRPEERGKRRGSAAGSSHTGDADAELDGWQSEREESYKPGDNSSKKAESKPLTSEEADMMYKKLIEAEKKFQALLEENDSPNRASKLEEDDFQDLVPEEEEVDYDLDASAFIKKLKEREKRFLYGGTWDQRLAHLSDQNDEPSDSEALNSRSLSDSEQTTVELTSVNEAIDRVISSVVRKGPVSCLEESGTRTLSITASSDGSPQVVQDDKDSVSDEYDDESENLPQDAAARLEEQSNHRHSREDYNNIVSEGILVSHSEQTTATSLATSFSSLLEVSTNAETPNRLDEDVHVYPSETTFKSLKKVTFNMPCDQSVPDRALEPLLDPTLPFTVENTVIKGISFKILDSNDKTFSSSTGVATVAPPEVSDEAASSSLPAGRSKTQPEPSMPQIF